MRGSREVEREKGGAKPCLGGNSYRGEERKERDGKGRRKRYLCLKILNGHWHDVRSECKVVTADWERRLGEVEG